MQYHYFTRTRLRPRPGHGRTAPTLQPGFRPTGSRAAPSTPGSERRSHHRSRPRRHLPPRREAPFRYPLPPQRLQPLLQPRPHLKPRPPPPPQQAPPQQAHPQQAGWPGPGLLQKRRRGPSRRAAPAQPRPAAAFGSSTPALQCGGDWPSLAARGGGAERSAAWRARPPPLRLPSDPHTDMHDGCVKGPWAGPGQKKQILDELAHSPRRCATIAHEL